MRGEEGEEEERGEKKRRGRRGGEGIRRGDEGRTNVLWIYSREIVPFMESEAFVFVLFVMFFFVRLFVFMCALR